ncbi:MULTISPECIES: arylamine N-acetyltransferase family protein [Mammaliicoccus]|uniref:arylamine N-acetyltransferase family protein n=1 Tax=Mammaliicoccus TaxID=2803850 RepID=UPI001EFB5AC0|nr:MULTISPECIES: arylamine N-acetyltransferase [Mammaliicoccus]MEB6202009.1 arylamine N-acetyltransferase [Mammaliicoccus fleurettii]MEB7725631.1 arylamine N-acetyltransferase [Mammaliicoccus fleurettii]
MDIQQFENYLKIDTNKFNKINLESLNHYIKRFMYTVPFENISVQNETPISVDIDDLFNKIVHQHRGGFCYEMNTLFQHYLTEKGFELDRISGTVHTPDDNWSRDGSHMTTLVHLDKAYIADVGFGDLPTEAIPVSSQDDVHIINDTNGNYCAILDDSGVIHLQKQIAQNHWRTSYKTNDIPREWDFFIDHLDFNEHNPNSIFVQKLIITIPKQYGRVSMSNEHLTITTQNDKQKEAVTHDNYKFLLKKYFGIDEKITILES